jgi:EAL domain-containing protein (putative c-di-GMP-specific phosphodiesterase class I)
MAEETGLIVPMGWWILETACRQAKAWQDAGLWHGQETISVNLSALQLEHPDLLARVSGALEHSGLAGSCLVVEITESIMIYDPLLTKQRLESLKSLGIRIAMDDFGTGYSSLSYLHHLPIDVLKIDKSFVNTVAGPSPDEAPLVVAIIALAGSMRMQTVAEGIEDAIQRAWLEAQGCRFGQGYLFSRPLTSEAATRLFASHASKGAWLGSGMVGDLTHAGSATT